MVKRQNYEKTLKCKLHIRINVKSTENQLLFGTPLFLQFTSNKLVHSD